MDVLPYSYYIYSFTAYCIIMHVATNTEFNRCSVIDNIKVIAYNKCTTK